ncbi:hypothetical protein I4F81_012005 [Pyropia yezoensis]|uniref:Uncharacterized protein n=1 Tax=Pyropia yezoensis TaxID=2788 RepID=A0ACC3CHF3_PYRYE|nr:hypothetical protein I4F81_012005 [Neopyropia yezoensis]
MPHWSRWLPRRGRVTRCVDTPAPSPSARPPTPSPRWCGRFTGGWGLPPPPGCGRHWAAPDLPRRGHDSSLPFRWHCGSRTPAPWRMGTLGVLGWRTQLGVELWVRWVVLEVWPELVIRGE